MINKEDLKLTSRYFLVTVAMVLLMLIFYKLQLGNLEIFQVDYLGIPGILNPFTYNDSEWYLHIAEFGYTSNHFLFAFFPLYPILIRILHLFGIPYVWGGIIISWSSFFIAGYLLTQLLPRKEKNIGLAIFFLSPIAIFNLSVYTESLFLLLCLLTWYFYKNGRYLPTGITLGLAMITRNSAYVLGILLFLDFLIKNFQSTGKIDWRQGIVLFIPAGIIGGTYPLYTWITQSDLFLFLNVQKLYWGRIRMNPLFSVLTDINRLFSGPFNIFTFSILFNLLSIIFVIFLVIKFWKKEAVLLSFLGLVTLAALSVAVDNPNMPTTMSLYRYIWGTFPIYLLLPHMAIGLTKWKNLFFSSAYIFVYTLNVFAAFLKALLA